MGWADQLTHGIYIMHILVWFINDHHMHLLFPGDIIISTTLSVMKIIDTTHTVCASSISSIYLTGFIPRHLPPPGGDRR